VKCPLCDYQWIEGTPACLRCEFDFANNDARHAIQRLERKNLAGNGMWLAGTAMVFFSFAALFGLGPALGGILALALLVGGVMLVTFGLITADGAKKHLVTAKERTKLPPARVL
jgi:hypothetical protein